MGKARKWEEIVESFWEKVDKKSPEECWIWKGTICSKYGSIYIESGPGRARTKAHRISWMIHFGDIPEDQLVCHSCDNTICVNPNHLFLGTHLDNMRDMVKKGRGASRKGSKNNNAILTENEVVEIHKLLAKGSQIRKVAKQFLVSESCILQISLGQRWPQLHPDKRIREKYLRKYALARKKRLQGQVRKSIVEPR